jgi:hypothetical protein
MMRIIVIDPKARTVEERDLHVDGADAAYSAIREIIGNWLEIAAFRVIHDDVANIMWCDEEGLLHDRNYFFTILWGPQPYAGICVLTGTKPGEDGEETCGCTLPLEEVRTRVAFLGEMQINR